VTSTKYFDKTILEEAAVKCATNFLLIGQMRHIVFLSESCFKDERLMISCSRKTAEITVNVCFT
jgi:hypothetical protein